MLQAFREEGHELITLTGWQTAADRVEKIRGVLREIRRSKPDLCYIESPTYPIMRHADRKLIRTIHRMGIPIGYFYRDFYRKFPDEFPRRRSLRGRAKEFALDILQASLIARLHTVTNLFSASICSSSSGILWPRISLQTQLPYISV